MADSSTSMDCIDEVNATIKSNRRVSIEKCDNDSDPSTPTPIPIPIPPRSTFKSIVLVLTVTFAMVVNVGCLSAVAQRTLFYKPIIIDCEYFSIDYRPTNDSERVGLEGSTSPVDRIRLLFEFGM